MYGGEGLLDELTGFTVTPSAYEPIVPSVELPLFLRQNYSDIGVLTTYDETMDFDPSLVENIGLTSERVTGLTISAESKLTTLRSRKRVYNKDTGILEDYIIVDGVKQVPYEIGGDGAASANTFNTFYIGDGRYVGDFVTKITYYDEEGNVITGQTAITGAAAYVEFEYVIGGEFSGEEIIDDDVCDITFSGITEDAIINMPETGGTVSFDLSASCDWTAYVIEGEDEYLTLKHTYDVTGATVTDDDVALTITGISGFGSIEEINVESNTWWRLIDIPSDRVSFSTDYGVDFRDLFVTVNPYNTGGDENIEPITAATVQYGTNYGNTKYIVLEQVPVYITINGYTSYTWETQTSAATETPQPFAVNSSFPDWEIISKPDWCVVSKEDDNETLSVGMLMNETIYPREGVITIGKNGVYATLSVSQEKGTSYLIDVFQIVEIEEGVTGKSYEDIYLDGDEEALFGVEIYDIEHLDTPISTPWGMVDISTTFNDTAITNDYITTGETGFVFTNMYTGSGEAYGTVHVYMENTLNCSASTQTIYLSQYVLYVAPASGECEDKVDRQLKECDIESGTLIDFCDDTEQNYNVFTNVETGWTVEVEYGPYLSIDYTSLTYDCTSTYQKTHVGSNITWKIKKEYVATTGSVDDYQYICPDNSECEPTKEEKFAQMYERGYFVECGDYTYVHISETQYRNREDTGETYTTETAVTVENITDESPVYIKVGDSYWMKIATPDWCTVIPDNGSMDTEVGVFVESNPYNTRYLVLTLEQYEKIYDEEGDEMEVTPFKLFVIQEQCESDEPEIDVDTDELTFTRNTDFARIQISSNTSWLTDVFVESDGDGWQTGSVDDPEYGMLPTKCAVVSKLTDGISYDYINVTNDADTSNNGYWKKVTTPPSTENIVEDRGEWCTVIPEEGEGTQIGVVFVRTNSGERERRARLLISEDSNSIEPLEPTVVKILQLAGSVDVDESLYVSSGYTYPSGATIEEQKQWFVTQYNLGIFTDNYDLGNMCNTTAAIDIFTTLPEGFEYYIEFCEGIDLSVKDGGEDCTGLTLSCLKDLKTLDVVSNGYWATTPVFASGETPWLRVIPSNGYGDQTIGLFVDGNASTQERQCDLSFTGVSDCNCTSSGETSLTITITQEAASAITISPTGLTFNPKSDFTTVYLTSQNVGTWGVSEITNQGGTWCSVIPCSGVGSDTIVVKVAANIGNDRSCDITFTGVSTAHSTTNSVLHVEQKGPYLTVSPSSVGTLQGCTDFASVSVSCNTVWSASSDAAWCSVTPSVDDMHGNIAPNKLLIFVKENTGEQRSCTVTVKTMDGSEIIRTVTVTQAKGEGARIETPNVYLMAATKTGLTFGWDAVTGADSYDIYFDLASNLENGGNPTRVMDSFTGTAVTFTSLTSYLASSDDARVNILGGQVSGYTPEDN